MEIVDTPLERSKAGRPPRKPVEYEAKLLEYYAAKGNLRRAAFVAGVGLNTVSRRAKADRAFRSRLASARKDFIASLEERLVDMGMQGNNVVAILARLNATGSKTAKRYNQKAVEQSVTNNVTNNVYMQPPDTPAIMAHLRGSMSADELRAMDGEIVEADVLAIPEVAGAERPRDEEA